MKEDKFILLSCNTRPSSVSSRRISKLLVSQNSNNSRENWIDGNRTGNSIAMPWNGRSNKAKHAVLTSWLAFALLDICLYLYRWTNELTTMFCCLERVLLICLLIWGYSTIWPFHDGNSRWIRRETKCDENWKFALS